MSEEELILNNLALIRLVIKELKVYWYNQEEYQEYFEYGLEGLIKGAKTFDKDKNYKVSTYLSKCIKYEIIKFIIKKNNEKNKNQYGNDYSLEDVVYEYNNNEGVLRSDTIQDKTINVEKECIDKLIIEDIKKASNTLKEKYRLVFEYYYGLNDKQLNLKEISKELNISYTRTRVILRASEKNVKKYLEEKLKYKIKGENYGRKKSK